MREIRSWASNSVNRTSLLVKLAFAGYLLGAVVYFLIGLLSEGNDENKDDKYVVIIEWNLALGGMLWLLTFVLDWGNVYVTLKGNINDTVQYIEPSQ
jgi:hypothetical protein